MPSSSALLALPYPLAADANNVPADLLSLVTRLDAVGGGAARLTTTARDALAGTDLWDGRIIYNTTLARHQRRIAGAWGDFVGTFYSFATWAIPGEIKVPSGDTDFLVPSPVTEGSLEVVTLDKVRYKINSGTSVTFKLQVNGADATGFTGLSATTTAATTDPTDVALSDLDLLAPVVTAVSGTPKNLFVAAVLKHVVTMV